MSVVDVNEPLCLLYCGCADELVDGCYLCHGGTGGPGLSQAERWASAGQADNLTPSTAPPVMLNAYKLTSHFCGIRLL